MTDNDLSDSDECPNFEEGGTSQWSASDEIEILYKMGYNARHAPQIKAAWYELGRDLGTLVEEMDRATLHAVTLAACKPGTVHSEMTVSDVDLTKIERETLGSANDALKKLARNLRVLLRSAVKRRVQQHVRLASHIDLLEDNSSES